MPRLHDEWRRTVMLAVEMCGTKAAACDALEVTERELNRWIGGGETVPDPILVRALNLILDDPALAQRKAAQLLAAHGDRVSRDD